jgi:hypothetical protein
MKPLGLIASAFIAAAVVSASGPATADAHLDDGHLVVSFGEQALIHLDDKGAIVVDATCRLRSGQCDGKIPVGHIAVRLDGGAMVYYVIENAYDSAISYHIRPVAHGSAEGVCAMAANTTFPAILPDNGADGVEIWGVEMTGRAAPRSNCPYPGGKFGGA